MLVEINLLQKREQKNRIFYILMAFLLFAIAVVGAVTFIYTSMLKTDVENMEMESQEINAKIQSLQLEHSSTGLTELKELEDNVTEYSKLPIDSDGLVTQLTSLLPQDSFFRTFQYEGKHVALTVLFPDDMHAAEYYQHLINQEWVKDVFLSTVDLNENEQSSSAYMAQYDIEINQALLKEGDGQ